MKIVITTTVLFFSLMLQAQTRAVTDQGKEVILYDNGKWVYASDSSGSSMNDSIPTNKTAFTKPADATFMVKSKRFNIGININPNKWSFKGGDGASGAQEYIFTMKSTEGYGMLISEKAAIEIEALKEIAFINAKKAAPDAKATFTEYRNVNGLKVLYLEMQGTIKGMKIKYAGYYYSNTNGTIQLVSFCPQNSFDRIKPKLTELLNGLTETKD